MQYQFVKQVLEESDFDALASLDIFEVEGQQYARCVFRLHERKTYTALDPLPDSIYLTDGASPRRLYVTGELNSTPPPVEETAMQPAEEETATPAPVEETAPEATPAPEAEPTPEAAPATTEESTTEAAPETESEPATELALGDAAGAATA